MPEPWRTRTLLEIGGDLEEAYAAYRAQGLSEADAAEQATALLGLNEASVQELSGLHTPAYALTLAIQHRLHVDDRRAVEQ